MTTCRRGAGSVPAGSTTIGPASPLEEHRLPGRLKYLTGIVGIAGGRLLRSELIARMVERLDPPW